MKSQYVAVNASDFWTSHSGAYSFGPSFRWQIFSAGRIRSHIKVWEARTEQVLANYETVARGGVAKAYNSLYKALGGGTGVEVIPITEPRGQANSLPSRKRTRKSATELRPPTEESD